MSYRRDESHHSRPEVFERLGPVDRYYRRSPSPPHYYYNPLRAPSVGLRIASRHDYCRDRPNPQYYHTEKQRFNFVKDDRTSSSFKPVISFLPNPKGPSEKPSTEQPKESQSRDKAARAIQITVNMDKLDSKEEFSLPESESPAVSRKVIVNSDSKKSLNSADNKLKRADEDKKKLEPQTEPTAAMRRNSDTHTEHVLQKEVHSPTPPAAIRRDAQLLVEQQELKKREAERKNAMAKAIQKHTAATKQLDEALDKKIESLKQLEAKEIQELRKKSDEEAKVIQRAITEMQQLLKVHIEKREKFENDFKQGKGKYFEDYLTQEIGHVKKMMNLLQEQINTQKEASVNLSQKLKKDIESIVFSYKEKMRFATGQFDKAKHAATAKFEKEREALTKTEVQSDAKTVDSSKPILRDIMAMSFLTRKPVSQEKADVVMGELSKNPNQASHTPKTPAEQQSAAAMDHKQTSHETPVAQKGELMDVDCPNTSAPKRPNLSNNSQPKRRRVFSNNPEQSFTNVVHNEKQDIHRREEVRVLNEQQQEPKKVEIPQVQKPKVQQQETRMLDDHQPRKLDDQLQIVQKSNGRQDIQEPNSQQKMQINCQKETQKTGAQQKVQKLDSWEVQSVRVQQQEAENQHVQQEEAQKLNDQNKQEIQKPDGQQKTQNTQDQITAQTLLGQSLAQKLHHLEQKEVQLSHSAQGIRTPPLSSSPSAQLLSKDDSEEEKSRNDLLPIDERDDVVVDIFAGTIPPQANLSKTIVLQHTDPTTANSFVPKNPIPKTRTELLKEWKVCMPTSGDIYYEHRITKEKRADLPSF